MLGSLFKFFFVGFVRVYFFIVMDFFSYSFKNSNGIENGLLQNYFIVF